MKRSIVITASALVLSLGACALPGREAPTLLVAMPGQLEPLHAAAITRDLAVFRVTSNGCTEKSDLMPVVDHVGNSSVITLRRIEQDLCNRPALEGVELIWSFEELGLTPGSRVSVNNPYQMQPSSPTT